MNTNKKKPFIPFTKNGGGNKPHSSRGGQKVLHASKGTTHTQNHLNNANTVLLESLMNHCICII
jgi:hypothetical protein